MRSTAPYAGLHSLPRHEGWKTSLTATLFLGARLWPGAEGYFDPEVTGGEGFGGVAGIAGFPNGEIFRVASSEPEPNVARLYLRQDFGFGGETEKTDPAPHALGGQHDVNRLSIYVGKFAIADFFDNNAYSHDPRSQFENWALMENGAWDYPADTKGYTYGIVAELNQENWTLRYAAVTEPKSTPTAKPSTGTFPGPSGKPSNSNNAGSSPTTPAPPARWRFSTAPIWATTARPSTTPAPTVRISR